MDKRKWEYKKLGEVTTIINGKNQKAVEDESGIYPICGSGGIMGYANDFLCPEQTIIIGRKGNINRPIYMEQKFWNVDTAFGIVADKSQLVPKYLYYFCVDFNFERLNKAVTIPSLVKSDLLKIKMSIPPVSEQQHIVEELDLLSSIIEKKKAQLNELDNLAQSLFYEMFGDPITNESIWQYEKAKFDIPDDADYSRDIESDEIFSYIYNVDTVNKVLVDLMENGLKINGGDTIGKTIIFAHRHKHAELIVERFKELYPSLGDEFCQLIDNQVNYAQSIIDAFEVRGKMPMIAVSVDMLDTGIDVPDILNLVFFKQVRSKIKFLQMIGRGTRLSEEIFDEGETPADRAKKLFYIFDWCGNFEFFGENPEGYKPLKSVSLTERLFDLRVDLVIALQHERFQNDEVAKALHDETKAVLQGQVQGLNDKHISVREHWDLVDKYRKKDTWTYLSNTDGLELKEVISPEDICELERICWKELGTKEEYEKYIARSNMICGDIVGAFIRSQIGVDRRVAMERFSQFPIYMIIMRCVS